MNTFQISCFLTVARTLNFARAAGELSISQPAVTHQIRSLETELNTKLFKRTTRLVELTAAGYLFLSDAQNIFDISMRAKRRFENPAEQEMQTFSIGCHGATHLFQLPAILRKMHVLHPNIHPRLRVIPNPHSYRLLDEEDVDVITSFKEADTVKTTGSYKEIYKVSIVCVCSRDNPLSARSSVTLDSLTTESLIINEPRKSPAAIARIQGRLINEYAPSHLHFCESPEASLVLVEAGYGVAILPDMFIPPDSPIVRLPLEQIEQLSFGVYYKTLQGNKMLKSFIQIMKEHFS